MNRRRKTYNIKFLILYVDDELSEVFRDVHISYDEAFFELEKVLSLFQERIQEIHQVKFLFEYFRNPDKEKQGKLSFDEVDYGCAYHFLIFLFSEKNWN